MPVKIEIPTEKIGVFCRKWSVKEFALFGSVLRDDFGPDSDVDVLVTFSEDARRSLLDHVRMLDELRDMFGRDVDLAQEPLLENPYRRREILRNKEVVYAA